MNLESLDYSVVRFVFQRLLAFVYLMGFLIAVNQFQALSGSQGLLPVRLFVKRIDFWDSPSLFYFFHQDPFIQIMAWFGLMLSLVAVLGLSDLFSTWLSVAVWFFLWLIYLSFVNVGQTFYGFGWNTLSKANPARSREGRRRSRRITINWIGKCGLRRCLRTIIIRGF